jgi:hypothetical protein
VLDPLHAIDFAIGVMLSARLRHRPSPECLPTGNPTANVAAGG